MRPRTSMTDCLAEDRPSTEFQVREAARTTLQDLVSPEGYVVTYPHRHGMDGSFAARLVRAPG